MLLLILENFSQVSENFHSDGGACIICKDSSDAIDRLKEINGFVLNEEEELLILNSNRRACTPYGPKVHRYEISDNNECKVIIFPDAGCC